MHFKWLPKYCNIKGFFDLQIRYEYFRPCECEEQWNAKSHAMSEDCLYLNIWRPVTQSPGEEFPVMIWFYGGGFVQVSVV